MEQKRRKNTLAAVIIGGPLLFFIFSALLITGLNMVPIDPDKVRGSSEKAKSEELTVEYFLDYEAKRPLIPAPDRNHILLVEGGLLVGFILLGLLVRKSGEFASKLVSVVAVFLMILGLNLFLGMFTITMQIVKASFSFKEMLLFSIPINYLDMADIFTVMWLFLTAWAIALLYFAIAMSYEKRQKEGDDAVSQPA